MRKLFLVAIVLPVVGCGDTVAMNTRSFASADTQTDLAISWDVSTDQNNDDVVTVANCATSTDCDDGILITTDTCTNGVCQHTKDWGVKVALKKSPDVGVYTNISMEIPGLSPDGKIYLNGDYEAWDNDPMLYKDVVFLITTDKEKICGTFDAGLAPAYRGIHFKSGDGPEKFQEVANQMTVSVVFYLDKILVKEVPLTTVEIPIEMVNKWPTYIIQKDIVISLGLEEYCQAK